MGTTSAGIVYTQGLPDYEGALSRDECLRVVQEMTDAVTVPISVDSEDGYGDTPEDVAETFKMMIVCQEALIINLMIYFLFQIQLGLNWNTLQ